MNVERNEKKLPFVEMPSQTTWYIPPPTNKNIYPVTSVLRMPSPPLQKKIKLDDGSYDILTLDTSCADLWGRFTSNEDLLALKKYCKKLKLSYSDYALIGYKDIKNNLHKVLIKKIEPILTTSAAGISYQLDLMQFPCGFMEYTPPKGAVHIVKNICVEAKVVDQNNECSTIYNRTALNSVSMTTCQCVNIGNHTHLTVEFEYKPKN